MYTVVERVIQFNGAKARLCFSHSLAFNILKKEER